MPLTALARGGGRRPLASHLALLSFVLLAPIVLLAVALTHAYVEAEHDLQRRQAQEQAHVIASRFEQAMARRLAALQVLAEAPALDPLDAEAVGPQLQAVARLLGGSVTLQPPRPLAGVGDREALPAALATGIASVEQRVLRHHLPAVSDLLPMPGESGYAVLLAVPVLRQNELRGLLWLMLRPEAFLKTLAGVPLPRGWIGNLVDSSGTVVARSARHGDFLGQPTAFEAQRNRAGPSGTWTTTALDGQPVMLAYVMLQASGWRASVLVPLARNGGLQHSLLLLGLGAAGLIALAAGLAVLFARGLARPVRALAQAAHALGRGEPVVTPPASIEELHAVGTAMAAASIRLRARERALAESEARLARALKAARIATWEWEVTTDSLAGSRGREALYGRPAGTLRDLPGLLAATHPEDRDRLAQAMQGGRDPAGSGVFEVAARTVWPDGRIRWLQSQGAVMERGPGGEPLRLSGVVMDVTEAQAAMEREKLLVAEVDHRARNVLTVVQSLLKMSRADDPAHFAAAVQGRVAALARAHTLLARERWDGGELFALARETLGAHVESGHVLLRGRPVDLAAHAVQPLSMVLHELATNAAQHGALSRPPGQRQGQVVLSWLVQGGVLSLSWHEHHGPAVSAPGRRGFGLRVVENTITRQLGGQVELQWQTTGLICRLRIAADRVLRGAGTADDDRSLAGLR
ncbi:HWE histidine kinase domain-containing protein [Roseomonas sp. USHLN139]|uniref:HWE histidine kinase domain-containing protein n=1 Tax=Roseomonas sp. USHLN139 TaxID=3081298 RepID=UPI003B014DB5